MAIHQHIPIEKACNISPCNWVDSLFASGIAKAKAPISHAQFWISQV